MTNVFVQPEWKDQQTLLEAIERNDVEALGPMIIAAALYEEDSEFVEAACLRLSKHEDEIVRGNAILGFGHTARLAGKLSRPAIEAVRDGLQDPSGYVRGQAHAAAGDLEHFLEVDVRT